MRRTALRGPGLAASIVFLVASAQPADAVDAAQGIWSDGSAYTTCGAGISARQCSFSFFSHDCTEAAVLGQRVAGCDVWTRFDVLVTPIVQAGRVVGCRADASAPGTTPRVSYRSTVPDFSNPTIDEFFTVRVFDLFADGKPGLVSFKAADLTQDEGGATWIVEGEFVASCKPNQFSEWTVGGTGSVEVRI